MADIIKGPKGVPDYIPPQSATFRAVQEALSRPAQHAGYGYIELPVYEDTALFVRGVGESTDVVSKEMFTFTDRGERSITLRPEGTAFECVEHDGGLVEDADATSNVHMLIFASQHTKWQDEWAAGGAPYSHHVQLWRRSYGSHTCREGLERPRRRPE